MKNTVFESDYSPGTNLRLIKLDDGDVIIKIIGSGEMRIAASGGKLHGEKLVQCLKGFDSVIDALIEAENENK